MEIITDLKEAKELRKMFRNDGQKISLVPTMGKLHYGHLNIVKNALKYGKVFVSIYVNPLQFGPSEDFNNYPRDIEGDIEKLRQLNVDCVYMPDETITKNNKTFITDDFFSNKLCGLYRPGHFQGVLTIVMKLLSIVQPDFAFFGLKDYQQYILIKKMAEDFFMDVKIMPVPIVREECGLAMSSRNLYFNVTEKEKACNLYKILNNTRLLFKKGKTLSENLKHFAIKELIDKNFTVEYVEIMDKELIDRKKTAETGDIILSAVKLAGVRLIDNIFLE
jgi:pantoate--beta-alanine ligase